MRAADLNKDSSAATSRSHSSHYHSRVVCGFSTTGKVRVMVESCSKFVPLAPVLGTLFLCPASKNNDIQRKAAAYINRVNGVALPDLFPDKPVLAPDGDPVEPSLPSSPCSVPASPEPVRNDVAEWGGSSSLASFSLGASGSITSLCCGDSGHPRSPAPVAAGPAVGFGHLDNDATNAVHVVSSSTELTVPVSTPSVFVPDSSTSTVASVVVTSSVARNIALNVAPSGDASIIVALVTVSCDFAPVTALTTASSALPSPIPALSTFPSSPLAPSASASLFLNMPASADNFGVTLRYLRNRLARRDVVYTDLKDPFVAREVDVKRMTAEVLSLTEQLLALRD